MTAMLPGSVLAADPVATDDTFTVPVNSPVTNWAVMDNDIGTDLDLHEELATPAHGVAFVNGTHVHYTPDEDFHGTDTFDYTIEEGAVTDVGTVTVIVNTPPVAVDDPTALCESPGDPSEFGGGFPVPEDFRFAGPPADTFLLFGNCALLKNDTDVDGDTLTFEILTQPANGEAVKLDEEFFTYKADPDYGTLPGSPPGQPWLLDTFTYRAYDGLSYSDPATMSFWVAAINDPPTFAPGPATVIVAENSGHYNAPWATNMSPGPFGESAQTVEFLPDGPNPVDQGLLDLFSEMPAIDATGNLTFTLNPGVHGLATVTFVAKDDGGVDDYGLNPGDMVPPDDTTDPFSFQIAVNAVIAVDDNAGVAEDAGPSSIDVLANDAFVPAATITAVTQGTKGSVQIAPDGLSLTYDPNTNATGADTFTYTLSDGEGGHRDGECDHRGRKRRSRANNDAGLTVPESAGPTNLLVLSNDNDLDGDALHIVAKTNGAHGVVTITGGGTGLTYDPDQLYVGTDVFTYTVSDGHGGTDTATVLLTVVKDTAKPVATATGRGVLRPDGRHAARSKQRIAWSGTDAGTGVAKFQLQAKVGRRQLVDGLAPERRLHIDQPHPHRRARLPVPRTGDGPRKATSAPGRTARRSSRAGSRTRARAIAYVGPWTTAQDRLGARRQPPLVGLGRALRHATRSDARHRPRRHEDRRTAGRPRSGSTASLAATIDLH